MKKFLSLLVIIVVASGWAHKAHSRQTKTDLSSVLEFGYLLNDSNEDSLADEIIGKVILPDKASESQIIAASNIAARLAYETTAMNFDLVQFESERNKKSKRASIIIGSDFQTSSLAPGQGSISMVNPSDPNEGIYILGYDASGLLAASDYLSGQYPVISDDSSYDLVDLKEKVMALLNEDSIEVSEVKLTNVVLSFRKQGITKASFEITGSGEIFDTKFSLSTGEKKKWTAELIGKGVYQVSLSFLEGPDIILQSEQNQPNIEESNAGQDKAASSLFGLSEIYSINGFFKDTNKDKIADDSQVYVAYAGTEAAKEVINFAARIGLETAGIRLPIVFPLNQMSNLDQNGFPVLVGVGDRIKEKTNNADDIFKDGGYGRVELKEHLFEEDSNGLVVTGKSENELQAALSYLTLNLPYVWDFGKGNLTLEEVQTEARRFFQGVTGEGQVANGIEKIDNWLSRLEGKDIEEIHIELAAKETPDKLSKFIKEFVDERISANKIEVETFKTGFGANETIFTEEITFPWEVDDFWNTFDNEVFPKLTSTTKASIFLRVSESPEMRDQIKKQIVTRLGEKKIPESNINIHVINAYKQGFSWIEEVMIPQLEGKDVASIKINYKHLRDSEEIKWQATAAKTRWLQELYPIDDIMANELSIDADDVTFIPSYDPENTYVFEAFNSDGETILRDSFDPNYVVRPYFDLFPDYDSVRVSTGWLTVLRDGETIVDQRIETDLERFWDHMQKDTYRRMFDYVMDIQDGKPDPDLAPYFDELRFDVTLSEPNRQLGILKEQISPMEALHEDIYFHSLLFFNLIGDRYGVGELRYPGRILPYMMPPEEGKPGKAKITFTGKKHARPMVVLRYKESGKEIQEFRYELPNIDVDEPLIAGVELKVGDKIQNLFLNVKTDKNENPYNELKTRGSESYIDGTFVSAERLSGMVNILNELRDENIFSSALSVSGIENITFRFALEDSTEWLMESTVAQTEDTQPTIRKAPLDKDFVYKGQNLVQWETPIPPSENNEILAKLNTFENINVYYAATSMLGEKVYAMDLLPATDSKYISQAKLNALKPTLFISGRQHANEFSSTSHILKLAEKVATDPEYGKYLANVNLVLHPITNPDGAKLAVEMHEINETYMHHAGYFGPLGVDVTRDENNLDPRYEVAKVRREIHDAWLPDVFINMHGYPPHEWVQYFAGYSAWMMSRERGPRSNNYWIPRGYFLTGFGWYDHEDFPSNKDLSFALLDSISSRVDGVPAMREVNLEMQKRYKKYRSQEDAYGEFYQNDIWVNAPLKGREQIGSGYNDPNITYFTITSEAPDEPARGEWMEMNAAAGVAHSTGALQYLYYGKSEIEQVVDNKTGRTLRSKFRMKPFLPQTIYDKYQSTE